MPLEFLLSLIFVLCLYLYVMSLEFRFAISFHKFYYPKFMRHVWNPHRGNLWEIGRMGKKFLPHPTCTAHDLGLGSVVIVIQSGDTAITPVTRPSRCTKKNYQHSFLCICLDSLKRVKCGFSPSTKALVSCKGFI